AATACAGVTLVGGPAPTSLLALTADEVAANAARTDGRRLALLPTGGVVHDGTGYLFYDHAVLGPGVFDREDLGTGLCALAAGAAACERIRAGGTTVLWAPGARVLNRGGAIDGDRARIAGCRRVAAFEDPCVVTGAPLDRLADPAAYQVLNVFSGWVDALPDATAFADAAGALTVSPYQDGFLITTLDIFASRFEVRRARRVGEDVGHPVPIFDAAAPPSLFVQGGREHAGLRRGDEVHISYVTDGAAAPGLHLATFRFFGGWQ
ncbi:MAG: hypothetical protein K8W52_20805, partial [Deltaproteobacteria bacterium]|nr:hypothetical protein [Deltaproteobacteria bacterium]